MKKQTKNKRNQVKIPYPNNNHRLFIQKKYKKNQKTCFSQNKTEKKPENFFFLSLSISFSHHTNTNSNTYQYHIVLFLTLINTLVVAYNGQQIKHQNNTKQKTKAYEPMNPTLYISSSFFQNTKTI